MLWTSKLSAGMSQGSPASLPSTYSSSSFFRPALVENSSARASTFTMIDGFHLLCRNPVSVAAACFRLLATVESVTVKPSPRQG